jgi:hypothetical protein
MLSDNKGVHAEFLLPKYCKEVDTSAHGNMGNIVVRLKKYTS